MDLTEAECNQWKADKTKNPRTKRLISPGGPTFKKIESICKITKKHCDAWHKEPKINPITNRIINQKAKNGVYTQLLKLCGHKSKTPPKLLQVLQKRLDPILNKGDSLQSRKMFSRILTNYLGRVKPCLENVNNKLVLLSEKNEPIVGFEKQIGSKSIYGMAYMNMGKGFAKLLKFSCKIMESGKQEHKEEVNILRQMSQLAFEEKCPNMPITYKTLKCTKKCSKTDCPTIVKDKQYYVVINELADMDLQNWFKNAYDHATYESMLMQLMFSLFAFHNLGYVHNDAHLGNFLMHKIKPGGYWRYQVKGVNVYVPNTGYLLVLWDPGLATKGKNYDADYDRCMNLMSYMDHYKKYQDMQLKKLPNHIIDYCLTPMINLLCYSNVKEEDAVLSVLENIKSNVIKFKHILVDEVPDEYLLNIRPYKCF